VIERWKREIRVTAIQYDINSRHKFSSNFMPGSSYVESLM